MRNQRMDIIQDVLKTGFHEVCIEISGKCNAQCKYCPSGKKTGEQRGMMSPETFERVLDKLISYGIIGEESQIDLFWWGEPLLNPNLNAIIEIAQKKGVDYVLSTNGFYYQKIPKHLLKGIKRLIISMPGFSQASYDRIHRFDFETIKRNIRKYAEDMHQAGELDKIWVAYHVYQFNLDELYDAYNFCKELQISFNPGYAFPLLVKERIAYASNTLPLERKEEMLKEVVTFQLDKMIAESDKENCIYQRRNFIVDEKANVYGCLNLEHDEQNYCGNLFEDEIEDIYKKIANLSICDECIQCGVAPADISFKFFFDSWFQMMKKTTYLETLCKSEIDNWNRKKQILQIIMNLRAAEQKKDKQELFSKVKDIMLQNEIPKVMIDGEIDKWAMRPCKLQQEFNDFWEQ